MACVTGTIRGGDEPAPTDPQAVGPRQPGLKRAMDIAFALGGLAIAVPLCLIAMLVVWIADGRPVLLGQWRLGHGDRLFRLYKIRTMYRDAERGRGAVCARSGDSRIIPVCRWIRRSHLDELPQLWNVLRGEMSLVGPRPERPEIAYQLNARLADFDRRTLVRQGLTGLAQVRQGYANQLDGHRDKLEHDLAYVRNHSIITDLKLLALTVTKLWDRTAC